MPLAKVTLLAASLPNTNICPLAAANPVVLDGKVDNSTKAGLFSISPPLVICAFYSVIKVPGVGVTLDLLESNPPLKSSINT